MPKEAKRLGDKQVAALKKPGLYPVGGVKGLALKVTSKRGESGEGVTRSWVLRLSTGEDRISKAGKPFAVRRDFGLGGYPDVSLAEARDRAEALRRQMRSGVDPVQQRKTERVERQKELASRKTFADLARECHKVLEPEFKNRKHAAQWINTLETYVFPKIGGLPVTDISHLDVKETLEPIWLTKHETATRVRQRIAAVFDFAKTLELRSGDNPADIKKLKGLLQKSKKVRLRAGGVKHFPRVPVDEMPRFMAALRARSGISSRALDFAILTAARSGQVRGAVWGEIDLKSRVWSLSAERMKTDRGHKVPLSDAAMALLARMPKGSTNSLVFPAPDGLEMSDATLGKVIKTMHQQDLKASGKGYLDPDQGRIATPHGTARSSFKDWSRQSNARVMANGYSTSFPEEWTELALSHVDNDATRAAYARSGLLEERRELMQAWADYLDQLKGC